ELGDPDLPVGLGGPSQPARRPRRPAVRRATEADAGVDVEAQHVARPEQTQQLWDRAQGVSACEGAGVATIEARDVVARSPYGSECGGHDGARIQTAHFRDLLEQQFATEAPASRAGRVQGLVLDLPGHDDMTGAIAVDSSLHVANGRRSKLGVARSRLGKA